MRDEHRYCLLNLLCKSCLFCWVIYSLDCWIKKKKLNTTGNFSNVNIRWINSCFKTKLIYSSSMLMTLRKWTFFFAFRLRCARIQTNFIHLINCSVEYVQLTIFSSDIFFFRFNYCFIYFFFCVGFFIFFCCMRFSFKSNFIESANFYLNVDINTHQIVVFVIVVVSNLCLLQGISSVSIKRRRLWMTVWIIYSLVDTLGGLCLTCKFLFYFSINFNSQSYKTKWIKLAHSLECLIECKVTLGLFSQFSYFMNVYIWVQSELLWACDTVLIIIAGCMCLDRILSEALCWRWCYIDDIVVCDDE